LALAEGAQARDQIMRYLNWFLGNTRYQQRALKVSIRGKDRRDLSQAVFPVGKLPGCCVAGGPLSLPASEVGKLKRWFGQLRPLAGCKSGIEFRHLLHEDSD